MEKTPLELLKKRLKELRRESHFAWKYNMHETVQYHTKGEIKSIQYAIRVLKREEAKNGK